MTDHSMKIAIMEGLEVFFRWGGGVEFGPEITSHLMRIKLRFDVEVTAGLTICYDGFYETRGASKVKTGSFSIFP